MSKQPPKKTQNNPSSGEATRAVDRLFDCLGSPPENRKAITTLLEQYGYLSDKDIAALLSVTLASALNTKTLKEELTHLSNTLVTLQQDILGDVSEIHHAETSIQQAAHQICAAAKDKNVSLEKIASVQNKLGASIARLYSREGRGFVGFITTVVSSLLIGAVGVVYLQEYHPEVVTPLTTFTQKIGQQQQQQQ